MNTFASFEFTYNWLISLEPRDGIEPPITDYKSVVIPFNYRGLFHDGGPRARGS